MFFLDKLELCKSWLNVESINVRCSCCSIVNEESSFESSRNAMKTIVEFLLFLSIVECSNRFHFSSACVLSSRVSSSLHRFESFSSRDFFHDQKKSRRTRDEVSSTSRNETRDFLQISIHFLSKNHDYWNDEVFTCVSLQFIWSSLALIRRIDDENSFTRWSMTFFVFTSHENIVIEIVS